MAELQPNQDQGGKPLVQSFTFWGAIAAIASAGEHISSAGVNANDLLIIFGALTAIWGRIRASHIVSRFF